MTYKFEEGKNQILDAVVEKIQKNMPAEQAELCSKFFRQFFGTVALEDLNAWSIDDLYGASVNMWHLIQSRKPKETKIRIYNPDYERHGWQTTHTVVEIISADMPFLVDSIRMVVNRLGLSSHLIIHMGGLQLIHDDKDQITKVLSANAKTKEGVEELAPIFMEIDRQTDPQVLDELYKQFERVLEDNKMVVEDWHAMRKQVNDCIKDLDETPAKLDSEEVEETKAFLRWIEDHHFTFLGIRDYKIIKKGKETCLEPIPETGLGGS